ncbi:MAG: hypothetical protein Sapg2KO_08510 [Saprospiraceae bacterium]
MVITISAQRNGINEVRKGMSMGVKEAFTVDVSNLSTKETEKVLMSYLKDVKGKKGPKKDRKTKEILVDNAEMKAISGNTVDIYATMDGKGDNSTVTFWFDLGGAFLSQDAHPDKMEAVSEWLYNFSKAARLRTVELELEAEEDQLKALNKAYDKLQKEQEKLEDTIKKAEETIANAKADLKSNANAQDNSKQSISEQERVIQDVKEKLKKVN